MRYRNLIGPQVRKLRYKQGWTQRTLATKLQLAGLDVSRCTVGKIEARLVWVADHELFYFTKVFGVELADLFPSIHPKDPDMHETLQGYMNKRM